MYAEVYLPIAVNHPFSYIIPSNLRNKIKEGSLVKIPFNNQFSIGYIDKIIKHQQYSGQLKSVDSIISTIIVDNSDLRTLIDWMHRYYLTPKGLIIKNLASFLLKKNNHFNNKMIKNISITSRGYKELQLNNIKGIGRKRILDFLATRNQSIKINHLRKKIKFSNQTINTLLRDQYIIIRESKIEHDPLSSINIAKTNLRLTLSVKQNEIFKKINNQIKLNKFSVNLIHGVTGSGKTEIYIKLVEKILNQVNSALILVPEIILTPETAKRFKQYFKDKVGIWNSRMTPSEKKWTWDNIVKQKIKIVIGTRSAVFLPLQNLSVIIVDEEHDASYKQNDTMPTYNARDVSIIRAKNLNIPIVLGSATPSIESYYNGKSGKYKSFSLMERYGEALYPKVELINMFNEQNNSILSQKLISEIEKCLERKEQIILLHNRRGYSSILQCTECGYIFTSLKTSVPLTYHKVYNQLICHHTEERYNIPSGCSQCNSEKLEFKGIGTEKVEDVINQTFPNVKILRFDSDSTSKKNSYQIFLEDFEKQKADILIGTQMVSKGFDFHNVTLVGVLNADIGLFSPDFRSGERIFQLLYQVCGRSGRGKKLGKAIIQSFNINDPYIQSSSMMNTKKYYNILLADRLELKYPPFSKIIRILLKGEDLTILKQSMGKIIFLLKKQPFNLLGPTLAPIEKINNFYRLHIILKTNKPFEFQDYYWKNNKFKDLFLNLKDIKYHFDVDPLSLL